MIENMQKMEKIFVSPRLFGKNNENNGKIENNYRLFCLVEEKIKIKKVICMNLLLMFL
jgi:hypothetical protein